MSVVFKSVKASNIRMETGTPGGDTYFIILPGKKDEKPLCFRRMHDDHNMRCTNQAGAKTWHVGTGACAFHGGNTSINPGNITTGRNAKITRMRLQDQIDGYLNNDRDKLLNLDFEMASAKAIYNEFFLNFPETDAENYGVALNRMNNLLSSLGNLAERISRTESRNTITAAQVLYIRATIADILMKYLTDPDDRVRAAKELAARLGGDISVEMRPSEYYLDKPDVIEGVER